MFCLSVIFPIIMTNSVFKWISVVTYSGKFLLTDTFQYELVFFSIVVIKMIRIFVNPYTCFSGFLYGNLLGISPVDPCISCKVKQNTYSLFDIQLMVNKRMKSLQSNLPLVHSNVNISTLCLLNLIFGYLLLSVLALIINFFQERK